MSFDEQPDGDIHGECAAEIRRLEREVSSTSAVLRMANDRWERACDIFQKAQGHLDACLPYLKEGETAAECLARNRADIARLMGKWGEEKMRSARLRTALNEILCLSTDKIADAYVIAGDALNPIRLYMEDKARAAKDAE